MNARFPYDTLRIALTHEQAQDTSSPLLSFEDIRRIAHAAVLCGVDRFEIAGGEPLEREDLPILLMMLSSLTVLKDMTLTTNGILLPRWAKSIRGAGICRVTVKLDTFDPVRYRALTGGDMTAVLAGIRALMEVGFPPATLQVRLIGGVNDSEIASLVRLTKMTGISLQLMELTSEEAAAFSADARLCCEDVLRLVPELQEDQNENLYRLPGAQGTVTVVPCSAREKGILVLCADGMLRAGAETIDTRKLENKALLQAMRALHDCTKS